MGTMYGFGLPGEEEGLFGPRPAAPSYPGDALEAPFGYIAPARAVRVVQGDANTYPVDAEGNELKWIRRPGVAPVYYDPTIDSIRMAMPGLLDIAGNVTGSPLGMIPAGAAAAAKTGRIPGLITAGGVGDDAAKGAGKVQRGIINTPDLRAMTQDEAISTAAKQPHLMQGSDGQYIGGPRGVTTAEQISTMRNNFDADVAAGASGGNWYNRARQFNVETAGSNPYRQRLIAGEEALWSAQANPDTNMGFQLQGHNAYEAGRPLDKVRTGAQAQNYNEARAAMDAERAAIANRGMMGRNQGPPLDDIETIASGLPSLGKKTGIYGQHLDPTVPPATTGTNDIWHARGFGYTNKDGGTFSRALTSQEHRFLDYETMLAVQRANEAKLGGRSDWTAAEIQAAPWVAGKGRALSNSRNMTEAEGIAEASKTYPDYANKYTLYSTSEQIPGKVTGLMDDVQRADEATKAAFSRRASWANQDGQDAIYSDMGFWTRPTVEGPGYYINSAGAVESNPVAVGRPMISYIPDKDGVPRIADWDMQAVRTGESLRALLDMQEAGAANKVNTAARAGNRNAVSVDLGRMPTKEELAVLSEIADRNKMFIANTDRGVAMIDYSEDATTSSVGKMLRGQMGKDLRAAFPDGKFERGLPETVFANLADEKAGVPIAKANEGKGMATKLVVQELQNLRKQAPGYFEKLLDSEGVSAKARANLERLIEFGGKGDRKDYENLLRIIGDDKLRGLMDRIQKLGYSGLPAIGGAAVLPGLLDPGASNAPD